MTKPSDPKSITSADRDYMAAAIRLGARNLGRTWPNPSVGCLIVSPEGRVVGRGWTQPGGRPHAETEALFQAGQAAKGGTAYVSLEPCAHTGKTGPCSQALIDAGVSRVLVGCEDPDPRVAGQGIKQMEAAGLVVIGNVMTQEAWRSNAGFIKRITLGRPLVALKTATTLDGRIATKTGESQWITGPEARQFGHLLRARFDAIMVGRGTVEADDPSLTCRLSGLEQASPVRIIMDRTASLSLGSQMAKTAQQVPTWLLSGPDTSDTQTLKDRGVVVHAIALDSATGQLDPKAALETLAKQGVTRLLIEGGGALAASFLKADLVDELYAFRAPTVIGGDGISSIGGFGLEQLAEMKTFALQSTRQLGADTLSIYLKT